jgi:hydrogenase maturation protein HypF
VDEVIGVACDGYGYGVDGEAWGGEILLGTRDTADFTRLAHLEPQPLIGGDVATRHPLRIAAAVLNKKIDVEPWLLQNAGHLPHGKTEAKLLLHQFGQGSGTVETTSCGRILDAVAAVLDVCYERTYEGEPAMKLESAAINGRDALKLTPIMNGNLLNTTQLLLAVFENRDRLRKADLAYSTHAYLATGLASLAVEKALENGICNVGFSGGAACNVLLASLMRKTVEAAGLRFLVHEVVPAGDGGVSFGQAAIDGFWRS